MTDAPVPSWEDVARRYGRQIYNYAYRLTGNSHDAADLVQEVLLDVDEAATVPDVAGHEYAVVVEPSRLLVAWRADGGDYLLVGDLPPDHLEAVLRLLPAPGSEGLFDRVWRSLFG